MRAFRIRNLDSGETVHVERAETVTAGLTTFNSATGQGGAPTDGATAGGHGGTGDASGDHGVAVDVIGTMQQSSATGKKYTAYSIEVTDTVRLAPPRHATGTELGLPCSHWSAPQRTGRKWVIERRYSDFAELDRMVRASPFVSRPRAPATGAGAS